MSDPELSPIEQIAAETAARIAEADERTRQAVAAFAAGRDAALKYWKKMAEEAVARIREAAGEFAATEPADSSGGDSGESS